MFVLHLTFKWVGGSGGLSPQTGIWTQTFSTSFPLTLILFGCSAPQRYSLIHFLLVTNPPSSTFFLPSQEESLLQPTHTAPSPLTYFPLVGFLGIWGWDGCCEEVRRLCKRFAPSQWSQASLCPLLQLNLLLTIGFFFNDDFGKHCSLQICKTSVDVFFADKQILTWSLCCVAICLKIVSNFQESFFLTTAGASFRPRDKVDSKKSSIVQKVADAFPNKKKIQR